jgi:hypothetical protein
VAPLQKATSLIGGDEGNMQQEWPAFDGFRLDASPGTKLGSEVTG